MDGQLIPPGSPREVVAIAYREGWTDALDALGEAIASVAAEDGEFEISSNELESVIAGCRRRVLETSARMMEHGE